MQLRFFSDFALKITVRENFTLVAILSCYKLHYPSNFPFTPPSYVNNYGIVFVLCQTALALKETSTTSLVYTCHIC